jgi:putative FmdB family regulatory protein
MPIYEFYCPDCHTIFSFLSRKVDTTTRPACPRCRRARLDREVSAFAALGQAKGDEDGLPAGLDETKMEQAVESLAAESERMNEDDPRQAAQLMRKFAGMTGLRFGKGMEEAMGRMEAGEDPEAIEQEMGDAMAADEDPLIASGGAKPPVGGRPAGRRPPRRDGTLYEM